MSTAFKKIKVESLHIKTLINYSVICNELLVDPIPGSFRPSNDGFTMRLSPDWMQFCGSGGVTSITTPSEKTCSDALPAASMADTME